MANEKTALLSGDKQEGGGAAPAGRARRMSRFGTQDDSAGVKPSRESMPGVPKSMSNVPRQRKPSIAVGGGSKKSGVQSFAQMPNGSVSALTPMEMGRQELYEEIPFLAVPGLQRKEHDMSIAFSSYAAFLDIEEADAHLKSTTGAGMTQEEKEKRASKMSMMMLGELEGTGAATVTMPLVFAVLAASFMTFNYGYNIAVMNPAEAFAFPGHSTLMWSIAVAAFPAGGPFGAVLAGKWADEKGRRGSLLLVAWLYVIGGLLQTVAPALIVVIVARAMIGVATGATTVLVPIYLGEVAPPNLRGVIGTMTQFGCVIGILFADIVGFPFGNEKDWRYLFLVIAFLGVCPLVLKPYLLESPRWLLGRDPDSDEARFVIKTLRGFRYDEEVETEVEHFVNASKKQSLGDDDGSLKEEKNVMKDLFADKKVRLFLISSVVLQMANQLSGINAVFYYSGMFLDGVIDDPLVGTTLLGTINVLATYVALLLMDRCGRRTLIIWSASGMLISCVMVVLSLLGYFGQLVALAAVASYVAFFAIGLGCIPSLIVAEMFDAKYVAAAMSASSQINWTCNFIVGLTFPYINKSLGPYSFGPFAGVLLLTLIYALIWLPETAGTTPEELQAALIKKNEGVVYHNMDIEGTAGAVPQPKDEWADALKSMELEKGRV